MIKPKRIFIDTSAWIELMLKGEKYHEEMVDYYRSERDKGARFFTSDYVLDESWTRLLTNQGFRFAKILKKVTEKAQTQKHLLILITKEIVFKQSWKAFEKFKEHKLSFTDATIYTFVKDLKIDEVLTLDKGFKKVGLTIKPTIR